jgi:hypothetical protein
MQNIKGILSQREVERSRSYLADAIPKNVYEVKKRRSRDNFQRRQKDLMMPMAVARLTKIKEQEEENNVHFSLEMIHRSTPNQLPFHKINPERYAAYDPTDRIYLQEYSADSERAVRGLAPRGEYDLVESTRRRVKEIEMKEAKRLNHLTENKFKHPHYLEKFLERKW